MTWWLHFAGVLLLVVSILPEHPRQAALGGQDCAHTLHTALPGANTNQQHPACNKREAGVPHLSDWHCNGCIKPTTGQGATTNRRVITLLLFVSLANKNVLVVKSVIFASWVMDNHVGGRTI